MHQLKRAWGAAWRILAFVLLWAVLLTPSIALVGSERGEGRGLDRWKLVRLDGPNVFTGGAFGLEGGLLGTTATASGLVALLFLRRWSTADRRGGAGDREP